MIETRKSVFPGKYGEMLAASLDLPRLSVPRAYALFAHCFTCSKDIFAAKRIAAGLANLGIATLRFDFTGLGHSEGEFANSNFASNVADLIAAADFLRKEHLPPALLIGHSLGGAAVLKAAGSIEEVKGVVTIGAPAEPAHVQHLFASDLDTIASKGEAEVVLSGRKFLIRKQFLDDLAEQSLTSAVRGLGKPLLVFHAPMDATVGIDNATKIFVSAKHPKSFVSLDDADHLLTRHEDANYVAEVITAWCSRFVASTDHVGAPVNGAIATELETGKFVHRLETGKHRLIADEPTSVGGDDAGPSPMDFLNVALAACTSMTLRMYANRKGWSFGPINVAVSRGENSETGSDGNKSRRAPVFTRSINLPAEVDNVKRTKLLEIANKCPVHRTLENNATIKTEIGEKAFDGVE